MKWSIYTGKIAGIKLFIHWTLIFFLLWIGFNSFRSGGNINEMYFSILFMISVFICVLLHELGHALTAKKLGYETKNITLLPIGGLAQMTEIPEKPKHELAVAISGPIVNLIIGSILLPISIYLNGISEIDLSRVNNLSGFIINLTIVNFSLAFFNLLPAFPMDGGRVLRSFLAWKSNDRVKATQIASNLGKVMAVIFFVTGVFFNPILALIGVFIFIMAHSENQIVKSKEYLSDYKVSDVLMKNFHSLQSDDKLENAINLLLNVQASDFVVFKNEKVVGTLSRDNIISALSENGKEILIEKAMNQNFKTVNIDFKLNEIYPTILSNGKSIIPVYDNGKFMGIIDGQNIAEFLLLKNTENKRKNVQV
ncbi:MAG: site-2 protease family protein [Bacteroidota bacterium]|jgi:Zn-dependent protease